MIYLKTADEVSFSAQDKADFLNILVQENTFLLSYTLLNNSFLFVLRETDRPVDELLRNVIIKFAKRYNKLHSRKGKIFSGRYASFASHSMDDVWKLISNTHSVSKINANAVSSSENYFEDNYIKTGYVLNFFKTKSQFFEMCSGEAAENANIKMSDQEVADYIQKTFSVEPKNLSQMPSNVFEQALQQIFNATKASVRQIARVSSLPLRMLWELAKKLKPHKKPTEQKVKDENKTN